MTGVSKDFATSWNGAPTGRLLTAGKDESAEKHVDHVGIYPAETAGAQLCRACRACRAHHRGAVAAKSRDLAEKYGSGLIRLTVGQNVIIPNVPDAMIGALTDEPLLKELRYDPSEIMRGFVSCTGMDYCHFALIETKQQALKTARALEQRTWKNQAHLDSLVRMPGGLQQPSGSGHRPHRQEHQDEWTGRRSGGCLPRRLERPRGKSADQNYGRCSVRGACPNAAWPDSPRRLQSDAAAAAKNSPNGKRQWRTSFGRRANRHDR